MEEGNGFEFTDLEKVNNLHQLFLIRHKIIDLAIFLIIFDILLDLIANGL